MFGAVEIDVPHIDWSVWGTSILSCVEGCFLRCSLPQNDLVELYVFDNLCAYMFVEPACQDPMLHQEVLLDGWRRDVYMQGLILDEDVAGVALDSSTHHFSPRLNDAVLVIGRFDAVQPHELAYYIADLFCVLSSHFSRVCFLLLPEKSCSSLVCVPESCPSSPCWCL